MLISATGRNRSGAGQTVRTAGFSLMEMMVVVFIIALVATAAVLTLPEPEPTAHKQAETLASELMRAGRESVISGEPIALMAEQDRYGFQRYRAGAWTPLGEGRRLYDPDASSAERTRLTVTSLQDLETAGGRRAAARERREAEENGETLPDIIFYPVGEATPAELIIERDGVQSIIIVSEDADVRIAGQVGAR